MKAPNPKHQISNLFLTGSGINPNHTNSKEDLFGYLKLEFGDYLGFGICDLGFWIINA